ncbi:hypothetical protein [Actinophytocola algeriensis]|uniref:Uncharacterized protein n=1 Tax=Actinophytocola algeriensis TaxID=1768010 RepID=A0A7W7VGP8_9PSEU|nr:hypothetical protein [Actinophytocola algeriensis]MBB4909586.1 hypothetical protein [Actinophytocola algeriensis]MBE1475576.1 hypothetical protein [Actinophytocola algeriensis]
MIRRLLVVAATLLTAVLLGAAPAWAHGGPIQLDVRSDGGQGVTATVTYVRDGHAVPGEVRMTYTAVSSSDGEVVGPVQLRASAEGQAFYQAKDPLPTGDWTVTVTATHPSAATKTVTVTSAELPPVATTPPPAPAGMSTVTMVAIPVAVAVVALAITVFLRRRRLARVG